MKKIFPLIVTLLMVSVTFSQNWQKTTAIKSGKAMITRDNLPLNHLFTLDIEGMKDMLTKSPMRGTSFTIPSVVSFPNTKGEMEQFNVIEAPVMHPDLAARYPEIKSYAGQGITDPSAKIRFSVSPMGIQCMRIGNKDYTYIEPISEDGTTYTVYNKSEIPGVSDTFQCMVEDHAPSNKTSTTPSYQTKNADDGTLRVYRLAVTTNGEYSTYFGGTVENTMAAINSTVTIANGIFETDFGVTLILIPNTDELIFLDAETDPYSPPTINSPINSQVQTTITSIIGEDNYDIGHLFGAATLRGGSAGCIGCVCNDEKGSAFSLSPTPVGPDYDAGLVPHEMGHQFGANHTWSHGADEQRDSHYEVGSGSTIMSYAGITGIFDVQDSKDPYYHARSIEQVTEYIKSNTCQTNIPTGNAIPVVDAGQDYTIPAGTPFVLTGEASDPNSSDILTYCWEQYDEANALWPMPQPITDVGPVFRSYLPTTSNQRYFPNLDSIKTGITSWTWESVPEVSRVLNFRLTVRDNQIGGGANNSDNMVVQVTDAAGPFLVNFPNLDNIVLAAGSTQTITWDVAGTTENGINQATVDILLSTDGGDTYPITLATNVPNDGSHDINVPITPGTQNRIMVKPSDNIFFDISNANFEIRGNGNPDTQAPDAITNLSSSNPRPTSVLLSWDVPADNIMTTAYDIYADDTFLTTVDITVDDINSSGNISYVLYGLNPGTSYPIQIRAKDNAGNESEFSNTHTITTLSDSLQCISEITTFPYHESFESELGAWTQATNDDFDWTRITGGTPSGAVSGPNNAIDGDYYIFIDFLVGTAITNETASIISPCINLEGKTTADISFQYHMYGNSIGTVSLLISDDNGDSWTSIWSRSGEQDDAWLSSGNINLDRYTGARVLFKFDGTLGGLASDIAIDDILITAESDDSCEACEETNVALGKFTEQSSTGFNGISDRAVDGNTSGLWGQGSVTHTQTTSQPWWQVYLGNEYLIGDITIWNRTDCCTTRLSNFDVLVYNDDDILVYETNIIDTPSPSVTIDTEGAVGSRVMIQLRGTNPLSLAEVEVYGQEIDATFYTKIEAEDYDAMSGIRTQDTENEVPQSLNVGWIDPGDWMDYNIDIPAAGTYTINTRVATIRSSAQFQFQVNGEVLNTVTIPNTGGWQEWTTLSTDVSFEAGEQTLRILATNSNFNINWLEITNQFTESKSETLVDNILIFPLPTRAELNISKNVDQEITTVEIVDLKGSVLLTKNLTEKLTTLDLSAFNSGLYIARFYGVNGLSEIKKIIKN